MISDELKNIVDTISEQGKMSFFDGVTEEQITRFEDCLLYTSPSPRDCS